MELFPAQKIQSTEPSTMELLVGPVVDDNPEKSQDESAEQGTVPTSVGPSGRGLGWNSAENLVLVRAGVEASCDSIRGTSMSKAQYRRNILSRFRRDVLVPDLAGTDSRNGGPLDPRKWHGRSSLGAIKQFSKLEAACFALNSQVIRVKRMSLKMEPNNLGHYEVCCGILQQDFDGFGNISSD
jgi:hypothetical protein